jgi:hypothetical protein
MCVSNGLRTLRLSACRYRIVVSSELCPITCWIARGLTQLMAQPIAVGGFGGQGFVLTAQHVPQAFNREGQIHNPAILAGGVGQKLSKARFQYTIRPSLRSFGSAGR